MAHDLDIRHFFQRAPKFWLQRYFDHVGAFGGVAWDSITARNVEPLMQAWLGLDPDLQGQFVEDFSNVKLLATPVGKVQIIDEARHYGKDSEVAAKLADLHDFYECAFWVLLEEPAYWNGAIFYAVADGKSKRYWRRRINLPSLGRDPTPADGAALGQAIADLFRRKEGRGGNCVVHQYRRGTNGDHQYYFAYPQDHRRTAIEYQQGQITKRPYAPAFEIVFVHEDERRTLNIWHHGKKERVTDLQVAFAQAVLRQEIQPHSTEDDRTYDLSVFLDPEFRIVPKPELGITHVDMRRMGVRILGAEPCLINIEVGDGVSPHVLYQRLQTATHDVASTMLRVARVGMCVTFERGRGEARPKTRTFDIVWPNSCSLQNDSHGILIQRMLADQGIELRHRQSDGSDGNQGP